MPYTISYVAREDGELIDPSEVVLADSADTYGVKRADTGEALVASDTAMVRDSLGNYSYVVEGNPEGVDLIYSVRATIAGQYVYLVNRASLSSAGSPADAGRYATRLRLYARFGEAYVKEWAATTVSEGEASDAAILSAIDRAIAYADTLVDSVLADVYSVPFTSLSEGIPELVHEVATALAGCELYEAQGMVDTQSTLGVTSTPHRLSGHKKMARRNLSMIKSGHAVLIANGAQLKRATFSPGAA